MRTLTRLAVGMTGAALTAGSLAITPATAADIKAGGIQMWGDVAVSTPQSGGPYKAFSTLDGTQTLAIGRDDKLVALPGIASNLAVPSDPTKPAGDVAGTTVKSVSVGHASAAWAVTADGAVHKWGGGRGIVIPDNTWTSTQLGDSAVEVVGGGSAAHVRLQGGGLVMLDSFGTGIHKCSDGAGDLAGVKQANSTAALLETGRVVALGTTCSVATVIAADATDPVTDLSSSYATTAQGKVYQHLVSGAPPAMNFPTGFTGKAIRAIGGSGSYAAVLTDQDQVVVWRPGDGGPVEPAFQAPDKLDGRAILSLNQVGDTFLALYADVANYSKPAISGAAAVGSELSATEGDWLGEPASLAYQWLAVDGENETEIENATGSRFTAAAAQAGKKLKVRVTATRGTQVVSATSDPTSSVLESVPALLVTTPASASGTAQVGETLTGVPAVFNDPAAIVTNQWFAGTEAIGGATGTKLVLTAGQVGKTITFKSIATRGDETADSSSTAVGPVVVAPIVAVPSITAVTAPARTYGSAGSVTVAVSNAAGRPVAGTITLSGAGAAQAAVVTNGQATFALDKALAVGSYTLTATFSGSAALTASAGTVGYTVAKAKTKAPTFKANKASTSRKKGKAVVTVAAPAGLAQASGKVTVTLKSGKTTKKINVTLSGGKKSISLPKLKKGTWKVQISYSGDKNYLAQKSKSYNLKIKK